MQGYKIEFLQYPYQSSIPNEISFSENEAKLVDNEVKTLIQKCAIEQVLGKSAEFISNLFLVPKKDGTLRPVINLRRLNDFIPYNHFKQENLNFALELINENDFMTSIDMKDAYFSISIHPEFRKFLAFKWRDKLYRFNVLPFGLASAPRIFTKVLRPIFAVFRENGIKCCYYIDDSLIANEDFEMCIEETNWMVQEFNNLGFTVNFKKSVLVPTKRIVFFGLIIDSAEFKVFLTEEKIEKILSLGEKLLNQKCVTVRQLASFIGLIVHAFNAVLLGPLHYRALERDKVKNLRFSTDYDNDMKLSSESRSEINWWLEHVKSLNGKPIRQKQINTWIETDASLAGWGTHFGQKSTGGRWSQSESNHHINYLELLAIFLSLKSFFTNSISCHVGIKSDNSTAVSYINCMGGMTSLELDCLSSKIWKWCSERNIFITAQYIPGAENIHADTMSRNFSDSKEWKLKHEIFLRVCSHFFLPDIDLFASRLNYQIQKFVSWTYDPEAFATDAFSISWSCIQPYIFPPFRLIGRILNKILDDKVDRVIMIVPLWPTQNWFPLLISALISTPARLPGHRNLLTMPHSGEVHPLLNKLTLVACVVSGKNWKVKEFQKTQLILSPLHGDHLQTNNMNCAGKNGIFGHVNKRLINLDRLKQKF